MLEAVFIAVFIPLVIGLVVSTLFMLIPTNDANVKKLKQYKELLDSGVITQEEFEQKKKELLNF